MRNITLKQLRAFAAVARTGSITRAARLLHVSPPAVTLQVQLLEARAGLPLAERSATGIVPTDAGRELLGAVERVESTLADLEAALAALAGSRRGTASVGVVSTAKYFAPSALAAFARAHPGIDVRITVGNRADIISGLRHYALDVAVMGRPPNELRVEATEIGDHPHVIVAPPGHPLARRRRIEPKRLAAETFLVREPGSGTQSLMERFFAEAGVEPRIGMQIGSNETIKQAVIAGLGVAFISGHTVGAEVAAGRLAVLDVKGLPILRKWFIVRLLERRLMPAVAAVHQFLVKEGFRHLPKLGTSSGARAPR